MEKEKFENRLNKALENINKMGEAIAFIKENQEVVDKTLEENPALAEGLASSTKKLADELSRLQDNLKNLKKDQKWYLLWETDGGIDGVQRVLFETTDEQEAEKKKNEWKESQPFSYTDGGPECYLYTFTNKEDFEQFKKSFDK